MEPVTASLMAIGSGSAAGLRPYFTVFALGLAGLAIPENAPGIISGAANQIPDSVANPWVLAICAILALGDAGVDKVPFVGLSMETVSAWLRPVFGSLVGLQLGVESGPVVTVLTTILGAGTSLPVSLGKISTTAATTLAGGGTVEWLRSLIEDFGAVILVVAAILLPILAAFFGLIAVGIGITLFIMFRKTYKAMKTKFGEAKQRQAEAQALRQAQIASGERTTTIQALKRLAAGATPAMAAGVSTSTGVMRTGASAATGWTKTATSTVSQAGSVGIRKATNTTTNAFKTAQARIRTTQPQSPTPPSADQPRPPSTPPVSYPDMPPRPPHTPTYPAHPQMPPQNRPYGRNETASDAGPATGIPNPQKPVCDAQPGTTPPPPAGRAQAAGERAGQAVSNVKGQVGKLRGQFDGFKKGLKQSGEDTPSGDQTPPSDR
ncbi:DUF4126 family protein [Brevibacterium aurantiacum]|uniref:DUF4126 domain-containing protein n=1 Tax=Brevibacterium aurantiacum TaxID=273384 RepID=A0A2H1KSZ6_BREAU|nr:protein of unknown function (DUF4126) [Brevibacterium aurantiacum]